MRADIAALGNEVDELRHAQDKSARELASLATELKSTETRLDAMAPRFAEAAESVRRLGARVEEMEVSVAGIRAQAESVPREPAPQSPPMAVAPAPAEPAARADAAEAAYTAALEGFRGREYGQAVLDFLDFLARFPRHRLASNAQYWIGEAYYVQRDFRQAAVEFQKVVAADAGGTKVPDALLKIGYCYAALRQPARAQQLWQQVLREYPGTEAARKARALVSARGVTSRHSR